MWCLQLISIAVHIYCWSLDCRHHFEHSIPIVSAMYANQRVKYHHYRNQHKHNALDYCTNHQMQRPNNHVYRSHPSCHIERFVQSQALGCFCSHQNKNYLHLHLLWVQFVQRPLCIVDPIL